ncbi:MAG: ribonuclease P protein component [Thermonemataceae bacterium]
MKPNQKLPKSEILHSKKDIQELFSKDSSSFYLYPFKLIFRGKGLPPLSYPQVLFSVPKKFQRKAVDRNLLRRRLKEIYRRNKATYYNDRFLPTTLAIIFTSRE